MKRPDRGNSELETRNRKLEIGNWKLEIGNSKVSAPKFQIIILIIAVMMAGCALRTVSGQDPEVAVQSSENRMITEMDVIVDADAIHLMVKGNQKLVYTSVKQAFPLSLLLYFSNTGLSVEGLEVLETAKEYNPDIPENSVIKQVRASELTADNEPAKKTSRIEISLKKESDYEIIREDAALKISFKKESPIIERRIAAEKKAEKYDIEEDDIKEANEFQEISPIHTATYIQTVYATKLKDSLKVFIGADGMITKYKAYTIDSPASIVFDIFDVKSPYKDEKIIAVNTQWISHVRYYGYSDRLRVVLDTKRDYLTAYSAYPIDNGLLIHVGKPSSELSGYRIPGTGSSGTYQEVRLKDTHDLIKHRSSGAPVKQLQAVYATQFKDGIIVTVRCNGTIRDYEASVTEYPPAIIFDIYDLRSNYNKEHSFPVDTQWVKSVRHEPHPDRLRLFIETRQEYFSKFSASPDENGLVIYIGKPSRGLQVAMPLPRSQKRVITVAKSDLPPSSGKDGEFAWVKHTDFLTKESGKSRLSIKTTRAVRYEMLEKSEYSAGLSTSKELELKLFDTQIPQHRQRPMIDYREDRSAVAQITPSYQEKNMVLFSIELNESVPYFVEQKNNTLTIHFEAPSIPLKSTETPFRVTEDSKEYQDEKEPLPKPEPIILSDTERESFNIPEYSEHESFVKPESPTAKGVSPQATDEDFDIDFSEESEKKYTGEPIALDFFETDIKNVFRILKDVSNKNFAIDNDVKGKVTLSLDHPVPWDQVLDLVLKMNQLGKIFEGDIIRIATLTTIQREEKLRQEQLLQQQSMEKQKIAAEPIFTEYIAINYSDASSEIKPHLEQILTPNRGSISVDKRTNMIIITDTQNTLKRAREIVEKLDRVTPQVLIEARIVEANTNFSKALGVDWGANVGVTETTAGAGADATPGVGSQRGYDTFGGTYGYDLAVNFPDIATYGTLGFNFTRLAGTPFLLNAKLMAMESNGGGKIISTPKILTLDNKAATISQGYEYPYQSTDTDGNTTTEFKDIDLNLEVTPHITPDNRISMKVSIDKNDVFQETDQGPALSTKKATTELLVNDGDTIVIGGITQSSESDSLYEVPALSKIPLLGWLFKSKTQGLTKVELLIFITPRIVQLEQRRTQY